MWSTPSLLRSKAFLDHTLYIHTAICSVRKVPLLSNHTHHLFFAQLQWPRILRLFDSVQPSRTRPASIPSSFNLSFVHSFSQLLPIHTPRFSVCVVSVLLHCHLNVVGHFDCGALVGVGYECVVESYCGLCVVFGSKGVINVRVDDRYTGAPHVKHRPITTPGLWEFIRPLRC